MCSSIASRCSSTPRMSGSANRRVSASSAVGGGSSTGSPHLAAPFSSSMAAARWEFQNCRQLQLQIFRRIQVVLKQKLHGAFARFASFAHKSTLSCRRIAGAGNEKLSAIEKARWPAIFATCHQSHPRAILLVLVLDVCLCFRGRGRERGRNQTVRFRPALSINVSMSWHDCYRIPAQGTFSWSSDSFVFQT